MGQRRAARGADPELLDPIAQQRLELRIALQAFGRAVQPRMLVTVALANKMARTVWALLTRHEDYRAPVPAAA